MRCAVGAVCTLWRGFRFLTTRERGTVFFRGAVFAVVAELEVCGFANTGTASATAAANSKATVHFEDWTTRIFLMTKIKFEPDSTSVQLGNDTRQKDRQHALVVRMPVNLEHHILSGF